MTAAGGLPGPPALPPERPRSLPLVAGIAGLTAEGLAGYFHPAVATALAIADAAVGTLLVLTIVGVILFGKDTAVDRVFRFLRWLANRPEPPSPPKTGDT